MSAVTAMAQVNLEVTLDQEQFLPGESLIANVRITNRSGETLHLGADPDWLAFGVESRDGYVVLKTGDVPVIGAFTLESSKRAIKQVDLAPYFNLSKPGRYAITATVVIKEWNQVISSKPVPFDVILGSEIWSQEIGVPNSTDPSNTPPAIRRYTLQQANHLKKGLLLYFRLSDPSGKMNKVFPIGPMISFGQPDAQLDQASNLHVLYQNGPKTFNYTVINPAGDVLQRRLYEFTTRPRMELSNKGEINVVGGYLRQSSGELPSAKPESTNRVDTPSP